jgi:hypothetical protein
MTYASGQQILASDYNSFLTSVNNVYGVGTGNSGYGQTGINQTNVAIGQSIAAAEWANLRSMVVICATQQGTATTGLLTAPTAGASVSASSTLQTIVNNIVTNRNVAAGANMTLTSAATTVTRATTWSTSITASVDVLFASEDAARHFFNAGGQIRLRFGHPNGSSAQDVSWRDVLTTGIGTVTMTGSGLSRSGNLGTVSSLGYFQMTASAATVFNGTNIGGGAYAANDVFITAQRLNFAGVRGGNGNGIRFAITLADEYTSGFGDLVSAGTFVAFDHFRSTYLTGIAAPTMTTVANF